MPGGPDVQHMPDPSSKSVSLSVSFLVLRPTTMKSAVKCDEHCALTCCSQPYPQTSDGQEPHGQDSPEHYITYPFCFLKLISNYICIFGVFFGINYVIFLSRTVRRPQRKSHVSSNCMKCASRHKRAFAGSDGPRNTARNSGIKQRKDLITQVPFQPETNSNDFGGFWELICRFEFDFRWCVQSSITHNVAVHVHVLWPVCAHTLPFQMLWCL